MRKRAAIALVACVLVAGVAGIAWWGSSRGVVLERDGRDVSSASKPSGTDDGDASAAGAESSQEASGDEAAAASDAIVVDVGGQVVSPGVYELTGDKPRVNDAIEAAGGLTEQAYVAALNLASPIADGEKVHVPTEEEATAASSAPSGGSTAGGSATASAGALAGSSGGGSGSSSVVNINTATAEELQALPGVGPSTAAAIVQDRTDSGPFTRIEDLMRVSGIGEKKFAKIKGSICV